MHANKKLSYRLKRLYANKALKGILRPLPRYGKVANATFLLSFVILVGAGAVALAIHDKKPQTVTFQQASSNSAQKETSTTKPGKVTSSPTSSGSTATNASSKTSATDGSNCTTTPVPYGVTDENDNALALGQTQVVSKGYNGTKMSCPSGKGYSAFSNTIPPINEVVDVGTGADALQQQEAQQDAQEATCQSLEAQEQTSEENVQNDETNIHNIEIEYGDAGAGGSSQEQYAEQQAEAQLSSDQATYNNLLSEIGSNNCG